jgi:hypothetical protein
MVFQFFESLNCRDSRVPKAIPRFPNSAAQFQFKILLSLRTATDGGVTLVGVEHQIANVIRALAAEPQSNLLLSSLVQFVHKDPLTKFDPFETAGPALV